MPHPRRSARPLRTAALACACLGALAVAGCGDDQDAASTATTTAATAPVAFQPIKTYLVDHTERLVAETAKLQRLAEGYHAAAKAVGFDHARLLRDDRETVARFVRDAQATWKAANPAYEEAEGVVAGVPSLAHYDVDLDAGSSGETPEDAVSFDITLDDGKVLRKPGNFFFLTETALWGTEEAFVAKGVEADLDGDGKVEFGEAVPDARFIKAVATAMAQKATALDRDAKAWAPTKEDVFNAVVVMTPTMSEYFEAWKNSRFVAGDDADESGFVGASRLSDIVDILSGLQVVYAEISPLIAKEHAERAEQTGRNLGELVSFVTDVRDREARGERFSAEQADSLGTNAQDQAEAIAGQVSQSAADLGIELEAQ